LEDCAVCISRVEELLFYPEGGGSAFLQNITEHLSDYMASQTSECIVMLKRLISRFLIDLHILRQHLVNRLVAGHYSWCSGVVGITVVDTLCVIISHMSMYHDERCLDLSVTD
jgi:hypothetical protein